MNLCAASSRGRQARAEQTAASPGVNYAGTAGVTCPPRRAALFVFGRPADGAPRLPGGRRSSRPEKRAPVVCAVLTVELLLFHAQ